MTAAELNPLTIPTTSGIYCGGDPALAPIPGSGGLGLVAHGSGGARGARVKFQAAAEIGGALAEFCAVGKAPGPVLPDHLDYDLTAGLGGTGLRATATVGRSAIRAVRIMGGYGWGPPAGPGSSRRPRAMWWSGPVDQAGRTESPSRAGRPNLGGSHGRRERRQ